MALPETKQCDMNYVLDTLARFLPFDKTEILAAAATQLKEGKPLFVTHKNIRYEVDNLKLNEFFAVQGKVMRFEAKEEEPVPEPPPVGKPPGEFLEPKPGITPLVKRRGRPKAKPEEPKAEGLG